VGASASPRPTATERHGAQAIRAVIRFSYVRAELRSLRSAARGDLSGVDALRAVAPRVAKTVLRTTHGICHDPAAPVLVLSPHLDDAVLSCWSVLTTPREVAVANVFTSVPRPGTLTTWDRITGASDSAAAMKLRLDEDRRALALAGRRPLNLDLADKQYRRRAPSALRLLEALERALPAASAVYAPAAIGGEADHRLVRSAALELFRSGMPVHLYADVPYAVRLGWPHWVTGMPRDRHLAVDRWWEPYLDSLPFPPDQLEPHVHTLSVEEAAAKLQAMRAYGTQYPALTGGPVDLLGNPDVGRHEVTWSIGDERATPGADA
jgi:LmbE family N-acetylglucosaminyl deacetylase